MLKKAQEYNDNIDASGKHLCKSLIQTNGGIEVIKIEKRGWYLVDNTVTVNKTDYNYAVGIGWCPFCGEKL